MKTRKFKITGIPTDREFNALPFGRQLEFYPKIQEFKLVAKSTHLSQKRRSYQSAIREAIKLHDVTEYYCDFYNEPMCKDDSFQFWYK